MLSELPSKWLLIEDRIGGDLAGRLRFWEEAGVSFEAMARMLAIETRVRISGESIRRWVRRLHGTAA